MRCQADAASDLAHAAFDQGIHAESGGDLTGVQILTLEGGGGGPRGDPQSGDPCKSVGQLFRHSIAEILVFAIGSQIDEREHRNRWGRRHRDRTVGRWGAEPLNYGDDGRVRLRVELDPE